MDTIKFENKGDIKMVAHRGLSGIELENTNAAFVFAGARSHFGIETDVHYTKDGKFVISHDANTSRVSGVDCYIYEATYEELYKIPFLDPITHEPRTDLHIPTLEDYIKICKKYKKECVLEIKSNFPVEKCRQMVDIINEIGWLENVTFISFLTEALENMRKVLPEHKMQLLTGAANDDVLAYLDKWNFDLDIGYPALTKEFADKVHAHGHIINCWTVDTLEIAEKMKECGVEYITSNILE